MENPIKMDDLGVPLFLETPIYKYNKSWTSSHTETKVFGILVGPPKNRSQSNAELNDLLRYRMVGYVGKPPNNWTSEN